MCKDEELKQQLELAINACSAEALVGNMPDFIVAEMLAGVMAAVGKAVKARDEWYQRKVNAPGEER
jgi:hypothetical protein